MKRKLTILLCGMVVTVLVSGCQGQQSDNEDLNVGKDSASVENQKSKESSVQLTLWGAEEDGAVLDEMVESFKKQYAQEADLDIKIEYHSESQCKNDLFGNVMDGPDVFTFADDQLRDMVAAGVLAPISDAAAVKSENIAAAVEAASINNTLYAYPMTTDNGYFLYYNKEYFNEEDVKSMDQLLQVATAAQKKVSMEWTSGWYLYAFFGCTGMEIGLNNDGVSNYCNWNATDTKIKGIDVADGMLKIAQSPGFLNCNDSDFVEGVKDGKIIAGVSGIWNASALQQEWGPNYAATKLPTYTCANQQVQMASFAGYKMVGVNDYSEHIEWAQKLAAWITNEENQVLRFTKRGQSPSNIEASKTPQIAQSPAIQALLEQSEFASLQRVGSSYWDPVQMFGQTIVDGNPQGNDLQELVNNMTDGITLSYNYGG